MAHIAAFIKNIIKAAELSRHGKYYDTNRVFFDNNIIKEVVRLLI